MVYRVFNNKQEQIAEVQDANWTVLKVNDEIPLIVYGKEELYKVIKVGKFNISKGNKLVLDIWVDKREVVDKSNPARTTAEVRTIV